MKSKIYYLLALVLALGLVFGIKKSRGMGTSSTALSDQEAGSNIILFAGEVAAQKKAVIGFFTAGQVSWVGVSDGDVVKSGQVLASLDKRSVEKSLQKKLLEFDKNTTVNEQVYDNYKDEVITDEVLRQLSLSEKNVQSSVVDVELDTLNLAYLNVTSPINGVVLETNDLYPGMYVNSTQKWFEIVDMNTLYFSVLVRQEEVVGLSEGMSGLIEFDAYPDSQKPATIKRITHDLKNTNLGTGYEVIVEFDLASDQTYKLGMTGTIKFEGYEE